MKNILLSLLIFISTGLFAGNYPGLDWKIINTENFNIIFDARLEEDAIRVASTIEELYKPLIKDMKVDADRYDIILTAEQIDSNGYVTSLGKKVAYFPVPPQDSISGSSNWYDLLTVHEYRHVVQQSKVRDSLAGKIRNFLFGDLGYNVLAPYLPIPQTLPLFFYEGDAVLYETLLTKGGRGRLPSFERGLRTILLSDKNYSYSKSLFGSKRDYTPNHYVYGYYLMTYLKREYGSDVISRVANFAANYPFPLNFSVACYFVTGETMPNIYKNSMKELKDLFEKQDSLIIPDKTDTVPTESIKSYTNYTYPTMLSDNRLAVIKSGLNNLNTLTVINNQGEEKELFKIKGTLNSHNNRLIYTKKSSDQRWYYREYNDIYIYNTQSGKEIKLTDKKRLFAPSFSRDGKKIAAIEHSAKGISSLLILDSSSGEVLETVTMGDYDISAPVWNQEDTHIAAFFTGHNGKFLGLLDLKTKEIIRITEEDFIDKTHISFFGNYIIFKSSYSGIDNIHAIDLESSNEYRVFSSRFGSDFPVVKDNKLIFSNYSLLGYRLESIELRPENWIKIEDIKERKADYFDMILENEKITPVDFSKVELKNYNIKEYSKAKNLINIHSWYINPLTPLLGNDYIYNLKQDGLFNVYETVIMSKNNLETLEVNFYNHINTRSKRADIGIKGLYTGFYPVVNFETRLLGDFSKDINNLEYYDLNLALTLPLSLNSDFTNETLYLSINPVFSFDIINREIYDLKLGYLLRFVFQEYGNSKRFLGVDLSFDTVIKFYHDLYYTSDKNLQLNSDFAVKGFFNSDNFRVRQFHFLDISNTDQIRKSEPFNNGINSNNYDYNSDISSFFRLDYILPILHPDLSLFNWLYFSEITLEAGYESMLEWYKKYHQGVEFTGTIYYRILRFELFDFYSDISINYSFDSESWNWTFMPIAINVEL